MALDPQLKKEIQEEFFLVSKNSFLGGAVAVLLALGVVSYGSAKVAVESFVSDEAKKLIEEAEASAQNIIATEQAINSRGDTYHARTIKQTEFWNPNDYNEIGYQCGQDEFLTGFSVNLQGINGVRTPVEYKFYCAKKHK